MRLRDTTQFAQDLRENGHNLRYWMKLLYIPRAVAEANTNFRLVRNGDALPIEFAHQAWRYGVDIQVADEIALLEWLSNICNWIDQEIAA